MYLAFTKILYDGWNNDEISVLIESIQKKTFATACDPLEFGGA